MSAVKFTEFKFYNDDAKGSYGGFGSDDFLPGGHGGGGGPDGIGAAAANWFGLGGEAGPVNPETKGLSKGFGGYGNTEGVPEATDAFYLKAAAASGISANGDDVDGAWPCPCALKFRGSMSRFSAVLLLCSQTPSLSVHTLSHTLPLCLPLASHSSCPVLLPRHPDDEPAAGGPGRAPGQAQGG